MSLKYEPASEVEVGPCDRLDSDLWLKHSSQSKNNHSTEMCSGSEAGPYLKRIDSCMTQLKAQGHWRACDESNDQK